MTYSTDFRRDDGVWTRIKVRMDVTVPENFFPVKGDFVVDDSGKVWEVNRRVFEYGHNTSVVFYCRPT